MKKTYLLAGVLIAAIAGAGYFVYTNNSDSQNNSAGTDVATSNESATKEADLPAATAELPTPSASPGKYIEYSDDALGTTTGTKLLFFHAPWCPQCRDLDESITTSTIPDNTTIFKVDYDSNQALRQKYGVTIQTTIVKLDQNNNKQDSYVAYQSPTFDKVKAALLP